MEYRFPALKPRTVHRPCRIVATGRALPRTIVSNAQIIRDHGHRVTDIAVQKTLGVTERRVADPGAVDTDLLGEAAEQCLARAGIGPERLSKLVVNKFLGDRGLPMTASLLQRRLKCTHAVQSFDVDGGASSFLQSVELGANAIDTGDDYVLIASGGLHNGLVSRTDPRIAFLYGDAAAAVLLGPANQGHFEAVYQYSNHEFADLAVGFSMRSVPPDIHQTRDYRPLTDLYRAGNWKEARSFIVEATQVTARELLRTARLGWDDIDLILLTENSRWLWQTLVQELGIDQRKTLSVLHKYGNTMSAMLPLLIDEAFAGGRMAVGTRLMCLSVGEGISGGGFIYKHGQQGSAS